MANAFRVLGGGGGGASVLDLGVTMTLTADNDLTAVFQSAPNYEAMKAAGAVRVVIDETAVVAGLVADERLAVVAVVDYGEGSGTIVVGSVGSENPSCFTFFFENGQLENLDWNFGAGNSGEVPFTIGENGGGDSGDIS